MKVRTLMAALSVIAAAGCSSHTAAPLSLAKLLTSTEFWAALAGAFAGALLAFAFGLWAQWRAKIAARRSVGNLAIITLAEMYSEVKALNDSIFVRQLPELTKALGRVPYYFEYRAVIDVATQPPRLDVEDLGFLVDSHDPDIVMRLVAARNQYIGMLQVAREHARLHLELQSRLAKTDPAGTTPLTPELLRRVAGADVMLQLKSVVKALQEGLPETIKALEVVGDQLRGVLLYQLPAHSFVRFIPEDRGKLSEAATHALKPALWRRAVRWFRGCVDRIMPRA